MSSHFWERIGARCYNFLIFLILSLLKFRLTLFSFLLSLSLSFLSFSLLLTELGSDSGLSQSPFFSLSYSLTLATSVDSGLVKAVKKMRSSLWFVGLCCWLGWLGCGGLASVAGFGWVLWFDFWWEIYSNMLFLILGLWFLIWVCDLWFVICGSLLWVEFITFHRGWVVLICDFGYFVGFVLWFRWVWFDFVICWASGSLLWFDFSWVLVVVVVVILFWLSFSTGGGSCDLILDGFQPLWWLFGFDFGWVSTMVCAMMHRHGHGHDNMAIFEKQGQDTVWTRQLNN